MIMLRNSLLTQIDRLPNGLTEVEPSELYKILSGPTLVHLSGRANLLPLFISVLLHGNEPTGLLAVQALLKNYSNRELPRPLSIFFGNVHAARYRLRHLDTQPDYNRIWPGTEYSSCAETTMTSQILEEMSRRNVFASIDIHNNTGLNPHYACVNVLDKRYLQLARLFHRLVVYFIRPKGVLSAAFAKLCPSVTLECGKPGQKQRVEHALDYLESCLHLSEIPDQAVHANEIDLFHTVAQVTISDQISFSFTDNNDDFLLATDLDHMNFTEILAGTVLGTLNSRIRMPLLVHNEKGNEVTEEYFHVQNNQIVLKKPIMPSMLTLDENTIRQDCLCYILERIQL